MQNLQRHSLVGPAWDAWGITWKREPVTMSSPETLSVGPTAHVTEEPAAVRPAPGRGLSGAPVGAVSVE